jgi:hypothetical protein
MFLFVPFPMTESQDATGIYRVALRRAFEQQDPKLLQVHFDTEVLDRYRGAAGFSVIRTNTVGRVRKEGGWSLDFGISPDEKAIHASWGDLASLPVEELAHWAASALPRASSRVFISMRLSPGACFEDGELRPW